MMLSSLTRIFDGVHLPLLPRPPPEKIRECATHTPRSPRVGGQASSREGPTLFYLSAAGCSITPSNSGTRPESNQSLARANAENTRSTLAPRPPLKSELSQTGLACGDYIMCARRDGAVCDLWNGGWKNRKLRLYRVFLIFGLLDAGVGLIRL